MPIYAIVIEKTNEKEELFCSNDSLQLRLTELGEDWAQLIGAPALISGTGSVVNKTSGDWKNLLGSIEKGAGGSREGVEHKIMTMKRSEDRPFINLPTDHRKSKTCIRFVQRGRPSWFSAVLRVLAKPLWECILHYRMSLINLMNQDKLVIVRSVVPTREMGYLPGSVEEKVDAYTAPYRSICNRTLQ